MAATNPVTPLPCGRAYSSRWAASGSMPTDSSGSSRLVFWSSSRISATSKCSRSFVKWMMFDFSSSIRSLTGIWKTSSGVRSANSMPAWWMAASFCCCWIS